MIRLLEKGHYTLIETKGQTKVLTLDDENVFAWINVKDIGEILITTHKSHKADHILSVGKYWIYDIKDEPKLTDLMHLELLVGDGIWQGYLLPTGLPDEEKRRKRIIPTNEIITKSTH